MLDKIGIVFVKEVIDNLRDWRSVFLALLYPFMGPLLIGILVVTVGEVITALPTTSFNVPVQGARNAPELIAYLEQHATVIEPATPDPLLGVRPGQHDTILVIPDDYASRFADERPAAVQLVVDGSRLTGALALSRVLALLKTYNKQVDAARLRSRGLEPTVGDPVTIEYLNVAAGRNITGFFLNMMPPFIIFTIFLGGVYLAIDTTSGERERGSLEPLLANPVARWELVAGKVCAALLFTAIALVVQLVAFKGAFELIAQGGFGLLVRPGLGVLTAIFLVCVPLMLLAVSVQMIIATVTRSFKETQTYLGLLPLVPAIPGLVLAFVAVKAHSWTMIIPIFGQTVLIGQLARDEPVNLFDVAIASGTTAALAFALLFVATRLYEREQLIFTG